MRYEIAYPGITLQLLGHSWNHASAEQSRAFVKQFPNDLQRSSNLSLFCRLLIKTRNERKPNKNKQIKQTLDLKLQILIEIENENRETFPTKFLHEPQS